MSSEIIVTVPPVNVAEVKYVFNCLLNEFLGLEYKIIISDSICDFSISTKTKQLIITNLFFRDDDVDKLYSKMNLPKDVQFSDITFGNNCMPQVILYGSPALRIEPNTIYWENDIVAATFFMLSRWEELLPVDRDNHDRFRAKDSISFKQNFLHRAIVNEYVEILYQILNSFCIEQKRIDRKYNTVPTHDVDRPFLWKSSIGKIRSLAASILLRGDKEEILKRSKSLRLGTDPYNTFPDLMDMAESINVKAHFFFMAGGESRYDNYYQLQDSNIVELISSIKKRNHLIGIHPSYNSYKDQLLLKTEINSLESAIGESVTFSRQHFLRFDVNCTSTHLDNQNIKWDSTLSYADVSGFRSGVCYEYPIFDLEQRKQLQIKERPLIVMDTTLQKYEKLTPKQALERVAELQKEVKKFEGDFVFLWHNSSFNSKEWNGFDEVYKSMYKQYKTKSVVWA